jgi:glycosyltransferase involved in cell wall biosynthesis
VTNEPRVSVIICTRNHAESLRRTLRAIGVMSVPSDLSTEILVVDNGSQDHTATVLSETHFDNVALRCIREATAGKSHACNSGVRAARGQILLFTDDDLRPGLDWVEVMCRPIVDGRCKVVQGGVSLPPHLHRSWLRGFLLSFLACTNAEGSNNRSGFDFVGANVAICRSVFDVVPKFDVELGPGSSLALGEDTLFGRQVRAAGIPTLFAHNSVIEHHFDQDRLHPRRFLAGTANSGRAAAYIAYHWEHSCIRWARLRSAYYRVKRMVRAILNPLRWRAGVPGWEAIYVRNASFYAQYAKSSRQPRNYCRFGLRKIEL